MTSVSVPGGESGTRVSPEALSVPGALPFPEALSRGRVALILGVTVFVALAIYYFVGIDEGMLTAFGKTMAIHEWVHDSRHFLGFPCH
jgi:putative cobalt transporter subunit CbtB